MKNPKKYNSKSLEKIEEKKRVLESARKLQNARKNVIDVFEKGIFPYRGNVFKTKEESEENKFLNILRTKQKILTMLCSIIILILQDLVIWQKKLFEIKDKKKNNDFVTEIKNRWSKIKDEIEEMSEEKKEESNKMLKNC